MWAQRKGSPTLETVLDILQLVLSRDGFEEEIESIVFLRSPLHYLNAEKRRAQVRVSSLLGMTFYPTPNP